MQVKWVGLAVAACAVAGCENNGSSSDPGLDDIARAAINEGVGANFTGIASDDLSTITAQVDGRDIGALQLRTNYFSTPSGIRVYDENDGDLDNLAFLAKSDSRWSYAGVAASLKQNDPNAYIGGTFGRAEITQDLPTTGSTDFTGEYAGLVQFKDGSNFGSLPSDDRSFLTEFSIRATYSARIDFSDNSFTGSITGRNVMSAGTGTAIPSYTSTDVSLQSGTVEANGRYSGVATGGRIDTGFWSVQGSTDLTGEYHGVVGGPNLDETAGVVVLEHDYTTSGGNPDLVEYGAFMGVKF